MGYQGMIESWPNCQVVDRNRILIEHASTGKEIVFVAAAHESNENPMKTQ